MTYPRDLPSRAEHAALERARDGILERLGVHFAHDDLTMPELEQRLEMAFRAGDAEELQQIVADLPPRDENGARGSLVVHDATVVPPRGVMGAFMGGSVRKGSWIVPRHLKVVAVMGGVELDLRQAVLGAGVTEIEVIAVMGGVDITVPPGVRVETMGVAVMGGFEASAGDAAAIDPEAPVLRLSGFAVMGGVDARMKRPDAKTVKKFNKALLKARSRVDTTDED